jgi:hypothetical protein
VFEGKNTEMPGAQGKVISCWIYENNACFLENGTWFKGKKPTWEMEGFHLNGD